MAEPLSDDELRVLRDLALSAYDGTPTATEFDRLFYEYARLKREVAVLRQVAEAARLLRSHWRDAGAVDINHPMDCLIGTLATHDREAGRKEYDR